MKWRIFLERNVHKETYEKHSVLFEAKSYARKPAVVRKKNSANLIRPGHSIFEILWNHVILEAYLVHLAFFCTLSIPNLPLQRWTDTSSVITGSKDVRSAIPLLGTSIFWNFFRSYTHMRCITSKFLPRKNLKNYPKESSGIISFGIYLAVGDSRKALIRDHFWVPRTRSTIFMKLFSPELDLFWIYLFSSENAECEFISVQL